MSFGENRYLPCIGFSRDTFVLQASASTPLITWRTSFQSAGLWTMRYSSPFKCEYFLAIRINGRRSASPDRR